MEEEFKINNYLEKIDKEKKEKKRETWWGWGPLSLFLFIGFLIFGLIYFAFIEPANYRIDLEKNITTQIFEKCFKEDFYDKCECLQKIVIHNHKYNWTPLYYGEDYLFRFGGTNQNYAFFYMDIMRKMGHESFIANLPLEPPGQEARHYHHVTFSYFPKGYCIFDEKVLWKFSYDENPYINATNIKCNETGCWIENG